MSKDDAIVIMQLKNECYVFHCHAYINLTSNSCYVYDALFGRPCFTDIKAAEDFAEIKDAEHRSEHGIIICRKYKEFTIQDLEENEDNLLRVH